MSMRLYHPDGIGSTAHQPTKNTLIRSPLQSNQNQISKIKSNQIKLLLRCYPQWGFCLITRYTRVKKMVWRVYWCHAGGGGRS